jgi:hypothetical protein
VNFVPGGVKLLFYKNAFLFKFNELYFTKFPFIFVHIRITIIFLHQNCLEKKIRWYS